MLELLCLVAKEKKKSNKTDYSKHFLKYAILITQFCIK